MELKRVKITCPHCGHPMRVEVDYSNGDQDYYEDCANCCNPVHLNLHIDDLRHKVAVAISGDDEQLY